MTESDLRQLGITHLRTLVSVLGRIERCDKCIALIADEGADECHHAALVRALGQARLFLATLPPPAN